MKCCEQAENLQGWEYPSLDAELNESVEMAGGKHVGEACINAQPLLSKESSNGAASQK